MTLPTLVVLLTVFNLNGVPIANMANKVIWPGPIADCEASKADMSQGIAEAFAPALVAYWTRVSGDTVMLVRKQWCEAAAE